MHILFTAVPGNSRAKKHSDQYAKLMPLVFDDGGEFVAIDRTFDNIDEAEKFADGFNMAEYAMVNGGFKGIQGFAEENAKKKTVKPEPSYTEKLDAVGGSDISDKVKPETDNPGVNFDG